MKKVSIILACMLCGWINLQAQQKFNVQNGTKTAFYNDLETAVQEAVSGDTIYLPGWRVDIENSPLVIDKKLALIGAGWDVDSIGGLRTTEIYIKDTNTRAAINFRNGSDDSFLTGCYLGGIAFGAGADQDIANVTIKRNYIEGASITLGTGSGTNTTRSIFILENFIRTGIMGRGASDCWINNNLIQSYISELNNSHIYNNVLASIASNSISGNACIYENNYISTSNQPSGTYCTYNNNAFSGSVSFPSGTNNGANNLLNQSGAATFEVNSFAHPKYLYIIDSSPCKNAGADGTDIGMYGGSDPYKAGAVPFHPHIDKLVISSQTDKDGNLKVDIQTSSQTK
ncbi:MAG: hypothetical protein LBT04_03135 [Prevotellaceae bacterium]|jgi:hypothetical protein|nr:hypothetical protein [Prevotellaceae bacterium]